MKVFLVCVFIALLLANLGLSRGAGAATPTSVLHRFSLVFYTSHLLALQTFLYMHCCNSAFNTLDIRLVLFASSVWVCVNTSAVCVESGKVPACRRDSQENTVNVQFSPVCGIVPVSVAKRCPWNSRHWILWTTSVSRPSFIFPKTTRALRILLSCMYQ